MSGFSLGFYTLFYFLIFYLCISNIDFLIVLVLLFNGVGGGIFFFGFKIILNICGGLYFIYIYILRVLV